MDTDGPLSSSVTSDLDRRIIAGWAAIEHGDLAEARAALSDVYSIDETHPGLPLLAAAIRRTRPSRVPWRGTFLLIVLIAAGGAWVVYSATGGPVHRVASTTGATTGVTAGQTPTPDAVAQAADSVGTSGSTGGSNVHSQRSQESLRGSGSDDALIRQGIARFAAAYSNRWKPVAFSSCEVARSEDSATATCQARGVDSSGDSGSGGTWVFTCRKVEDAWKIVSIQPPAE
jgi:hypothetical protein